MWRCPKCGAEVANSHQTCWVCGASADGVQSAGLPLPPVMATVVDEPAPWAPGRPQVGVPRRFGIGTLMILTTAFAVMFSLMKVLGTLPEVFSCVSIFVAGVAACQVLMFQGKNPRKASFVGGYIVGGVLAVGFAIFWGVYWREADQFFRALIVGLPLAALLGGPFGYLAGCVVAGIFLAWKDQDPEPTDGNSTS
jgi:hypothetical protein